MSRAVVNRIIERLDVLDKVRFRDVLHVLMDVGVRSSGVGIEMGRPWTQLDLADEIEVSGQSVENWLRGNTRPLPVNLYRLTIVMTGEDGRDKYAEWLNRVMWRSLRIYNLERTWYSFEDHEDDLIAEDLLKQNKTGAEWEERDQKIEIVFPVDGSDLAASQNTITRQLHEGVQRKAVAFAGVAQRLDNQIGWSGISSSAERFRDAVKRSPDDVPNYLGVAYEALIQVATFAEQDDRIRSSGDSAIDKLPDDARRQIEDLLDTAAPWLRRYPSIREIDDELNRFRVPAQKIDSGSALIQAALENALIIKHDSDRVMNLMKAFQRGDIQSNKSGNRGIFTVRNFIYICVTIFGNFTLGSISSDFANKSDLIKNIGTFLADNTKGIEEFISTLPNDISGVIRRAVARAKSAYINFMN